MTASLQHGGSISQGVEVSHISAHGFWLLAGDAELLLPFEDFPWFRDAPVGKVLNVQEPSPGHFYWPDLDVDLSAEIVANPGKYPLLAQR